MHNSLFQLKFTNAVIFVFILSYIPFYLIYEHTSIAVLFPMHLGMLAFLLVTTKFNYGFKRVQLLTALLFAYLVIHFAINYAYIWGTLTQLVIVSISFLIIYQLRTNELLYNYFIDNWIKFLWLLVFIALAALLAFIFARSLFHYSDSDNYIREEMYFLGRFFSGSLWYRYASFFNEPSYCGFFAGINAIMLMGMKRKIRYKFILITALFILGSLSQSFTFILSFAVVLLLYISLLLIAKRYKRLFINIILVGGVLFVYFNYQAFNNNILSINEEVSIVSARSTSYYDRNKRMENSLTVLKNSSLTELMFGRGLGYIVTRFDMGESNGYFNILIEYGIIGLFVLFYFLYSGLKQHYFLLIFIAISLTTIVIIITPFFLLNVSFLTISHLQEYKLPETSERSIPTNDLMVSEAAT